MLAQILNQVNNTDIIVNEFFKNIISELPSLVFIFQAITYFGSKFFTISLIIFVAIMFVLFYILTDKFIFIKKYLLVLLLATVPVSGIVYYLKIFIARTGPSERLIYETDYSFPSGHSAIAIALYGMLYLLFVDKLKKNKNKKMAHVLSFLLLSLIFLIPLSRLVLNVHYLSDIVVGVLMGAFGLLLGKFVYKRVK